MLLLRIISLLCHTPPLFSSTNAHKILPQNKETHLWLSAMGEKSAFRVTKWLLPTDSFHNRFKAPQNCSLWSPWDKNVVASNFFYSVFPLSCSCHWTCREMLAMFGDKHLCCLQLFWLKGMTELNSLWSQQDSYKVSRLKIFSVNFGVIISVMLWLVGLWSRTHPCCQPSVGWSLVLAAGCGLHCCHCHALRSSWERRGTFLFHHKHISLEHTLWSLPNRCLPMDCLIRQQLFFTSVSLGSTQTPCLLPPPLTYHVHTASSAPMDNISPAWNSPSQS